MLESVARGRVVVTTVGVLLVLYAITFFLGAWLHLGAPIPIGSGVLREPRILPATIVESLCGLVLSVSGYGVLTRKAWAWRATLGAHAFALAGVLLGIAALAAGRGPSTELNNTYHLTMLLLLGAGLVVLLKPAASAGWPLRPGLGSATRARRRRRRPGASVSRAPQRRA